MSDPADINDRLDAAATKAEGASEIMRRFKDEPQGVYIDTESGPLPSLKEWLKQNEEAIGDALYLQEEIESLKATSVIRVQDVRAMMAIDPSQGAQIETYGYRSTERIGGGSWFFNVARSKTAHNGGTIISPTVPLSADYSNLTAFLAGSGETDPSGVGCWERIQHHEIDVADFGAQHGQDIAPALAAAAVWCKSSGQKLVGSGRYNMSAVTVNLRYLSVDLGAAYITMADGAQLILGNRSNTAESPRQELGVVRVPTAGNAQVTSIPTVKVIGSKGQTITVASTNWLLVWASVSSPQDASSAYSTYNLGDIARIDLVADPAYPTGIQWINENTFNIKRIYNAFVIKSDYYSHNHNIINTGTFEEGAVISVERGDNNQFLCERFEGSAPIVVNMGVATWANVVEKTWHGNQSAAYDPVNRSVAVSDNGEGNMILTNADYKMKHSEVLTVNSRTCRSYARAG